jgi:predicted RNA-binding Zn-ribbon protein involved in translation (DUF1610 family)
MSSHISKSLRPGCLSIVLILILLSMMVGLIGLTVQLPHRVYTTEQQQWLSSNAARQVNQSPPEMYYNSLLADRDSKLPAVPAKPVAFGARESHITADMDVRYKDHEGATVTAYDLRFAATYLIVNPDAQHAITMEMNFPFPQTAAVLSEVTLAVDGTEPPGVTYSMQGINWKTVLDPAQERKVEVHYRAAGVGSFGYGVPQSQRMSDFDLRVTIRGAQKINIPESALEPTDRQDPPQSAANETVLSWRYLNTITNRNVQVELPALPRLAYAQRVEQLGQFFMQLAVAAPLLTMLFLLCWLAAMRLESLRVAREHLVLLGIGFFLFYPLFIFSASFMDLPLAFVVSLVVAGTLVVGYVVRAIGKQMVTIYLVPLLIVFYCLLTRGLTAPRYLGLMLVISAVVLAALYMWRVSRHKLLAAETSAPVEDEQVAPAVEETVAPVEQVEPTPPQHDENTERYCAHCGQRIERNFQFCPHCGKNAQVTRQCTHCGLEYVPSDNAPSFCPACGNSLVVE